MARSLILAALFGLAAAQWGRKKQQEATAGSLGDLGDTANHMGQNAAAGRPTNDVDLAMAGWEQLAKNPEKMQELVQGFKDPDVWNKATEMLKDPQYMAAAKAKVAELQAKAQANGLLDANGQPVPGAMGGAGGPGLEAMMNAMGGLGGAGAGAGAGAAGNARDWELENIERHKNGDMNAAELGFANLKNAMKDPSVMGEVAEMMRDPENMAKLKEMMANPTFQQQAKQMAAQMQASGEMPDLSRLQQAMQDPAMIQKAQQYMQAMGQQGQPGELERLKAENAALKRRMGA